MLTACNWLMIADRQDRLAVAQLQLGNVYEAATCYQLGLDALTRGLPTLLPESEASALRALYLDCIASMRERWLVVHWALVTMVELFVAAPTLTALGSEGKRLLLGDWLPAAGMR